MPDSRTLPRGGFVVALLAVGLAAFASCRAREGARDDVFDGARDWSAAVARLDSLPPLPSPLAGLPFWIGAWVGPPVASLDTQTWRTFRQAGLDVSMGPLEDRYRRADNLALLGSLAEAGPAFIFVRDDSLHPDETTRPGWEARIEAIVRAYAGAPALAGYFLADEPAPAVRAQWTPAARLLHRLDPAHPAYVNFLGLSPEALADPAAQARWRKDLEAAIAEGELSFFTVDAYPFGTDGSEGGHFLATLREAARVSHATGRPFGVVLQFTGHGRLRAVTPGEASYQAMQALAHGAACVIWFTYWTPDPKEEPWRWHGGAIAYEGAPTDRYPIVRDVNQRLRLLAGQRGARPTLVAHLGEGLPPGIAPDSPAMIPHLESVSGRATSVGFTGEDERGERRYVLVSRDHASSADIRVRFDASIDSARILDEPASPTATETGPGPELGVTLEPGGAAVIAAWRQPSASNPRRPSRSGRR